MIDRISQIFDENALKKQFDVTLNQPIIPKYNVAPTMMLAVITSKQPSQVTMCQWGLMATLSNNKKLSPKLFNLQIEEFIQRPSERKLLQQFRCIIPITGFFIWKPIGKKRMTPYYFHFNGQIKSIAGIWESPDEFSTLTSASVRLLITNANEDVKDYQEDMPLILSEIENKIWLNPASTVSEIDTLLYEKKDNLKIAVHPVAPLISRIDINTEAVIKPSNPVDQFGNYTLFG